MIPDDTLDQIESFYESREWEYREWELVDGVYLVIDWSLEDYREDPYLVIPDDEAPEWYESPEHHVLAFDHSAELGDLVHELGDVMGKRAEIHIHDENADIWS